LIDGTSNTQLCYRHENYGVNNVYSTRRLVLDDENKKFLKHGMMGTT